MNLMTYEEFMQTEEYQQFIKENPVVGYLKIMVFTAYQAIPIPNTEILITKDIGKNKVIFFRGATDSSGIIDNIALPATPSGYDTSSHKTATYTPYHLTAIHTNYETIKQYEIDVFGDLKIIQYIKMIPNVDLGGIANGNY